ncbi:ead/Ea22-like family protein [Leclercia sp.]|uniref:ead/Ea22-like family protein n=1 Tax=Leclercia sp. TaxID=1898428 RepID=UPI00390C41D7
MSLMQPLNGWWHWWQAGRAGLESRLKSAENNDIDARCHVAALEAKCAALAAENAALKEYLAPVGLAVEGTTATDAFLAEVRAQAHREGAHFVANRMLAAWDAGFIDDTAKNAADIARMILTSTEFMADAPDGDFDRSFADGVLDDIAAKLRQGAAK